MPAARRAAAAALAAAALLLHPAAAPAATLYGLIDTGEILHSADGGSSWSPLATLPVRDAVALSAGLTQNDLVLVTRSGSVYRSADAGAAWTAAGAIPAGAVVDLAVRPDGALLVLSADGSLHRSTDGGATFAAAATLPAPDFVSLTSGAGSRYYALTESGGIHESTDGGSTWAPRAALPVSRAVRIRGMDASLHVLTDEGDVYRSTDAGVTWTAVAALSQVGMRGLARHGSDLVAATREGHVAASADGATWTWRGSMNQLALTALATNEPAQSGVVPVAPPPAGLLAGGVFPNPSRGPASVRLRLHEGGEVRLTLFDAAGRLEASKSVGLDAGEHVVRWTPEVERPGVYYMKVASGGAVASTSWVVVR